jgi:hypothetical protein
MIGLDQQLGGPAFVAGRLADPADYLDLTFSQAGEQFRACWLAARSLVAGGWPSCRWRRCCAWPPLLLSITGATAVAPRTGRPGRRRALQLETRRRYAVERSCWRSAAFAQPYQSASHNSTGGAQADSGVAWPLNWARRRSLSAGSVFSAGVGPVRYSSEAQQPALPAASDAAPACTD